jgi:rod shape determining protein RodA
VGADGQYPVPDPAGGGGAGAGGAHPQEPNLGTAVITAVVGGIVFLGAGVRWWKVLALVCCVGAVAPVAYNHLHDYQRARITTFLHPESDPLGAGYNIIQSKIALGSGGMWGKGFLNGTQGHLNYLPEKQTDFIFTVLAEEFGLVGGLALLGLLLFIILGGMIIGLRCRHQYGRLVALGISMNFFMYVLVNVAMVSGAIPVGGVPLPLVSHGGTAMITVMIAMGVLMSVHVHRDVEFGDGRDEF